MTNQFMRAEEVARELEVSKTYAYKLIQQLNAELWEKGYITIAGRVKRYLEVIQETARNYVAGIMRRLREHEYNPELMKLYIVGGGGCLIRHFGEYDANRVTINDDICATAKGYEYLAGIRLKKAGAA